PIRYSDPLLTANEPESIAATVPARPHSAPVMTQTRSMIRPVEIPQARASVGLAAVARIALPMRVNVSSAWMAAIAATAMMMIAIYTEVRTKPTEPNEVQVDIVVVTYTGRMVTKRVMLGHVWVYDNTN